MKSFLEKSKRALVLLLTGAMIATSVPSTAFAAVGDADDVIIEEEISSITSSDVVDEVAEEIVPSDESITTGTTEEPIEDAENDSVEALNDDGTPTIEERHDLYVYKNTATGRMAGEAFDASSKIVTADVDLTGSVYGTELTTVTYTVRALYSSGNDQDYSALDWTIVKGTDDMGKAAIYALTEAAVLPEGLSIVANDATVTISGRPLEVCGNTYLYIVGTDRETDDTKSSPEKVVIPVDLAVARPTITITATDRATNAAVTTNKEANSVQFNTGNNGSATAVAEKMGYTVKDEDVAGAGANGIPVNIKPVEITIATTDLDTTYPMMVEASLEDTTNFQIVGTPTTRLDKNTPIKIKVAPKEGLACGAAPSGAKEYTTNLVLSSKGFLTGTEHKVNVPLYFKVGPDLAFTVKQGTTKQETTTYVWYMQGTAATEDIDGMDLWEDAAGTTKTIDTEAANGKDYYTKALIAGEVQVGKALDETSSITINATGGAGNLLFDDFEDSALPKGLTASKTEGSKNSTLTLSGTPLAAAYTWGADQANAQIYDGIVVGIKDNTSKATLNNTWDSDTYNGYVIKVKPADVAYSNEKGEVLSPYATTTATGAAATGVTSYEYAWTTEADNTTASPEEVSVGKSTAKFKIENKSGVDLTFGAEVYTTTAEGAYSSDFEVVNKSVTIKAGEIGYVEVRNISAIAVGTNSKGVLAITGNGIKKTHIRLEAAAVNKDSKAITTDTVLPATEVGANYTMTLKATPASSSGSWTIVATANGDSSTGTSYNTATNAKYISDTYGIVLNQNTGVLSAPNGVKKATYAGYPVKITVHNSVSGTADKTFTLAIAKAANGISLTSGGNAISETAKLKLADVKGDAAVGAEAEITIANNTSVDIGGLTATITRVDGAKKKSAAGAVSNESDPAKVTKYFKLVTVDKDGKEVKTDNVGNSVPLLKDKNYTLKLVSTPPVNAADAATDPSELTPLLSTDDPYEVTVAISGDNVATKTFKATLRVNSTFDIAAPGIPLDLFKVGTEVKETPTTGEELWAHTYGTSGDQRGDYTFVAIKDKVATGAAKANPKTDEVTFAWAKAASAKATEPDIKDSGLTLNSKGIIGGTPVKAGIYKVDVTATGHKGTTDYSSITGTKEFTIEVLGSATLTVNAVVGAVTQTINDDDVVVMQGATVGDTITSNSGFDVNVGATVKEVSKGIKITVEDVDTRTAAEKTKEKDVHAGSTDFIGTSVTTIASIPKDGHVTFRVVPKSTAKAGDYLAKVTLSGDEASTTYFFVEYIVSDAIEISTAGAALTTGVGDDYRLKLESTGASNAVSIKWSEVQQKATADIKHAGGTLAKGSYINAVTAAGTVSENDAKTENTTAAVGAAGTAGITGLALAADRTNPAGVDDIDLKVETSRAWIGSTIGRAKGHATSKGTFAIKIQAAADYDTTGGGVYKTISAASELTKNAAGTGYIARDLKDKSGAAITLGNYWLAGNGLVAATTTTAAAAKAAFGEQKATTSFTLTIGETEKVVVSDVQTDDTDVIVATYCPTGKATQAGASLAADKINSTSLTPDAVKEFAGRAAGTYKSDGITYVTVTGYAYKEFAVKASPTAGTDQEDLTLYITNGSGSDVDRTVTLKGGATSPFTITAGAPKATINAGATNNSVVIQPKLDTLKKVGEYSDTVVISGDNFKDIEFPISIKVAEVTKNITLYQRGEKNLTTTYDAKKDTTVVEKNEKKANITFKPTVQNGTPAENVYLFYKNTGNVSIDAEVLEVKDATGATYTSASEKRKLLIGTTANPTTTAPITGTLASLATGGIYVKVSPDAAKTAGVQTAYLRFTYDTDQFVVVPVEYTVYETGLDVATDVTPTDSTIEILKGAATETDKTKKYYAEGADFASVAPQFTITNGNTGDASKALYDITAVIDNTTDFEMVYSDATKITESNPGVSGKDTLTIATIAAGGNDTFKIAPKATIRNGENKTVNVTITSPSLSTPIIKTVKITVLPGTTYTEKVASTTGTALANNASDAYRLYRALVVSGKVPEATTGVKGVTVDSTTQVTVVLDEGNTTVVFTLANALGTADYATAKAYKRGAGITATIKKAATDISKGSFTVTLNETQKNTVSTTLGAAATANDNDVTFFDNMTFNYYSSVEFIADPLNYLAGGAVVFTDDLLALYGTTGVTMYVDTDETDNTTPKYNDALTTKPEKANKIGRVVIDLPNNTSLGAFITANGGTFPKATKAERAFEEWKVGGDTVNGSTIVKKNTLGVEPSWHSHKYSTDKTDTKHVTWEWSKLPSGKYTAKLTLHCTEEGCPDYEGSKVEITDVTTTPGTVVVTDGTVEATCEHGKSVKFTAEATYTGNSFKYTDEYFDETGETQPLGHDWKDAEVKWADVGSGENGAYTTSDVKVTRTCKTDSSHVKELTIISVNEIEKVAPKCEEAGSAKYGVTYTDVDKMGKPASNVTDTTNTKTVSLKAKGHNETPKLTVEDFNEETLKANVTAKCPDCDKELYKGELTATANEDGSYKFTFTGVDEKTYTVNWSNHEHIWGEPEWTYTVTSGVITGTAKFTCTPADSTIKPHDETSPIIVGTPTEDGSFKIYEITAKDPSGKEHKYDKTITLDADGNEVKSEAKTWQATYSTSGLGTSTPSVSIVFTGDNGAVDKVTVTPEAKVNGDTTTYSIAVKDRAGKTHKMSWDYKKPATEGGEPTITPGTEKTSGTDASKADGEISVAFKVDPETDENNVPVFVLTGAAVTPAVIVRDEDRDVTLAESVDYTLTYPNKNKVGDAKVVVKGKGNYATKTIELPYKLVALARGTDDIAVSKITGLGTFTDGTDTGVTTPSYNANAWVPESITVTVDDSSKASVVLKLQSDGTYASEDTESKTTAISISNNVNAGTATVSALSSKGKFVKKTFKIAKTDLSKAGDDLTFDPDDAVWAVKGAVPANLNIEYKGVELVQGQDFTVKYSYASKTKDAGEKAGKFIITGKKNFSGKSAEMNFDIIALELSDDAVSVAAAEKTKVSAFKPVVSDGNGVAIPAKLLKVTVVKKGDTDVTLAAKDKVVAGDVLEITVEGANAANISGNAVLSDVTVAANLGKAKVDAKSVTKYFTGEPVELTDEDMAKISVSIKNGPVLKYGEDYEIAGYQNNVKKGSMSVTIRGISKNCSGYKTFKVTIAPKTMKKAD